VTLPGWLAAIVLFMQLPIPLYWFVVHPLAKFWRRHEKAAYVVGLACSWLPVTVALVVYHRELFRRYWPPAAAIVAGIALIVLEGWIFWRVHRDLGTSRLVGRTEICGSGEVAQHGIYARIRHPRYTASFLAIVGACLLGGTRTTWMVAGAWLVLTRTAIALEERELRVRFGAAYEDYCRLVPRFIPRLRKLQG